MFFDASNTKNTSILERPCFLASQMMLYSYEEFTGP